MLVIKGVKVHDDTHRVLKELKEKGRNRSMDEVIRSLVKGATGMSVEQFSAPKSNAKITTYLDQR